MDGRTFALRNSRFWRLAAPNLERLIRIANYQICQNYAEPISWDEASVRFDLVGEACLGMFDFLLGVKAKEGKYCLVSDQQLMFRSEYWSIAQKERVPLSEKEVYLACKYCRSLEEYFGFWLDEVEVAPEFKGCGVVDKSHGDIAHDDWLFELKCVDRNFRGSDLRQLLVYCALDFSQHGSRLEKVGLINPRRGTVVCLDIGLLCKFISGKGPHDFFSVLIDKFCEVEAYG